MNLLGQTIFDRAQQIRGTDEESAARRRERLMEAAQVFERTLAVDSENVDAHYNLGQLYAQLGETAKASEHQAAHEKYKIDDTARGEAVTIARKKYPAADFAAEPLVIYDLQRESKSEPKSADSGATPPTGSDVTAGGEE